MSFGRDNTVANLARRVDELESELDILRSRLSTAEGKLQEIYLLGRGEIWDLKGTDEDPCLIAYEAHHRIPPFIPNRFSRITLATDESGTELLLIESPGSDSVVLNRDGEVPMPTSLSRKRVVADVREGDPLLPLEPWSLLEGDQS